MDYKKRYLEWVERADEGTVNELKPLSNSEIEDRFYTELSFGTAGLRGEIGAGTNRMNIYVVRRATQGLADYLKSLGLQDKPVAIAYDSRRLSDVFALETALVLAKNGIRAFLFEGIRSVPQLSFTVRHLSCAAGVIITASHNPATYNGYKVYWSHGGQLGPVEAAEALNFINRADYFEVEPMNRREAEDKGLLAIIGKEADEAYYVATETLLLNPKMLKEKGSLLNIVYTPLHGAGNIPVTTLLNRVGVTNVRVVKEQSEPDGNFPTVRVPNPQEPDTFKLAIKLADDIKADTILATDPDSDRLGVAARGSDGEFVILTGNQIGCLLIEYMLSTLTRDGRMPENALIVKSIVSTRLAEAICTAYKVNYCDVLTGFRFISEKIEEAERTKANTFLFGFEESYGFLAGGFSRDKDAVCAAVLVAEASVFYAQKGMTLIDATEEIYKKYGYYCEKDKSYTLAGKSGIEKIASAMRRVREKPINALCGVKVLYAEDYLARAKTSLSDSDVEPLTLPKSDMLRFLLEDGSWIAVRPSGTEPKLKLYVGVSAKTKPEAEAKANCMQSDADRIISEYLES